MVYDDGVWGPEAGLRLRDEQRWLQLLTDTRSFSQVFSTPFPCKQFQGHSQGCDYFFVVITRPSIVNWTRENNLCIGGNHLGIFLHCRALDIITILHIHRRTGIFLGWCSVLVSFPLRAGSAPWPFLQNRLMKHLVWGQHLISWKNEHNQLAEIKPQVNKKKGAWWGFSWLMEQILWGKDLWVFWIMGRERQHFLTVQISLYIAVLFVNLTWQGLSFLLPFPASKGTWETSNMMASLWMGTRAAFGVSFFFFK